MELDTTLISTIHAKGGSDPHWNSLSSMCAPCLVDYDWILRLEDPTLEMDSAAFLQTTGMASRYVGVCCNFYCSSQVTWRDGCASPRGRPKSGLSSPLDPCSLPPIDRHPYHLRCRLSSFWILCPGIPESCWQQLLISLRKYSKKNLHNAPTSCIMNIFLVAISSLANGIFMNVINLD